MGDSRKISSSMRNAITTNSYQGHALGKTVKQLEVERDLKMLSLQIKKDEVKFGSSSPKMKARRVMSSPGGETDRIDECKESDLTDKYDFKLEKKEIVSKQQFLPLIRSQSAKSRRTPSLTNHSSPPPSPRALHILRTNSLSSSTSSLRETDKDRPSSGAKDCQQRISPRYSMNKLGRSGTDSPILTAQFPKNHPPTIERRVTTGASPPTSGPNSPTIAHRGLAIRPPSRISNIRSTTKSKQEKTKVFSRLYQVQPKTKKTAEELLEAHDKPITPKLDRRRRSLSMPDLTDVMDGLRNCRYLRTNSTEDD